MSTINHVHGHEVIALIQTAKPALSRLQLTAAAARRWGTEARYFTCSVQGLTLDELLAFLLSHGKVAEAGGVLVPDMSKVCQH